MISVGTAGWAIPKANAGEVAAAATGLARYATVFSCTEINSTFKHEHRSSTYARWADAVPDSFRFSVKLPRLITHERRLVDCAQDVRAFLRSVSPLSAKLGPLLVQLPPSLQFDPKIAGDFFRDLRSQMVNRIVCEPRHASWFSAEADELLAALRVSRVAAHPAVAPEASMPGGYTGFVYVRLHGSPRVYYSAYGEAALVQTAKLLQGADSWCIFDNTASGAAFGNAIRLKQILATTAIP